MLTITETKFIRVVGTANEYLGKYWDLALPVDPVAIAKEIGWKICTSRTVKPYSARFYKKRAQHINSRRATS